MTSSGGTIGPVCARSSWLAAATRTARSSASRIAGAANPRDPTLLHELTQILAVKFDTTLVALSLAAVLVLAQHLIQRYEEAALNRAGQYCIDNLLNRLLNE